MKQLIPSEHQFKWNKTFKNHKHQYNQLNIISEVFKIYSQIKLMATFISKNYDKSTSLGSKRHQLKSNWLTLIAKKIDN